MPDKDNILLLIKNTVKEANPTAKVVLFGSYARGDYHKGSDIDLLILLDKEKVSYDDETAISFPLFMLEVKIGIAISPMIYSKDFWEKKHRVTLFYESVNEEGIMLC